MVRQRPEPDHGLHPFGRVLHLLRRLPYSTAIWLASRECRSSSVVWDLTAGRQSRPQVFRCIAFYIP